VPQLQPFRGLRYDPAAVADADDVICPPYDVISPAERATLARHPANAVHLELPESYERAAALFAAWQRDGTLRRDDRPMVYVYEARYGAAGDPASGRVRGFLCRLPLEEPAPASGVRPHEHTMFAPREDRFALLSAVRANLSPVVLLYGAPPSAYVDGKFDSLTAVAPVTDALDQAGVRHLLWAADPKVTPAAAELLEAASRVPLTIADGHHRYATALRYCTEVGGLGADHVMALLIDARSGGLSVRATHRLVRGADGGAVLGAASQLFTVEHVATADRVAAETTPGVIGLWTRQGGGRLRPRADRLVPLLPESASAALRALDVTTLNTAYPTLFGATAAELTAADRIAYTQDAQAAIAMVEAGAADVAFLLASTPVSAVLDVAARGEVMPPKSTYFYPKPATGLVFNVLDA
jgi:uncharacterized protein (DUF1015 family)